MLTKVQIRNFRTNIKLDVRLGKITTFIGPSYAGKSNVVRAIIWTMENTPAGDSYINWDNNTPDKASVKLTIEENTIKRKRSKKVNYYQLNNGKPYKAINREVPFAIDEILNVSDLNFQTQHDYLFWFNLTAGQVAKKLNAVINLESLDKLQADIKSKIRTNNLDIQTTKRNIELNTMLIKELKYIKQLDEDLKLVESLEIKRDETAQTLTLLVEHINSIQIYQSKRVIALNQASEAGKMLKKAKTIDDLSKKAERLEYLINLIEEKQSRLGKVQDEISYTKKEMKKIMKGRCPLCHKKIKS